jgi:hypothetical protein
MSYLGITGIAVSDVATTVSHDMTGLVAAKDIVRRNHIGQTVVVIPRGQPVPKGLAVEPDEVIEPNPEPSPVRRPDTWRADPALDRSLHIARRTQRWLRMADLTREGPR